MITSQPRAQTRSTGSVVRSGWTSSSQPNPNRAAAAGHTPSRRGRVASPRFGSTRARAQSPAWMVRSGFVARQNRPNSSEMGTRPTQTQTKAKPKTGLVSRSCPAIRASPAQAQVARMTSRAARRTPGWSTTLVRVGSGRPLTSAYRGSRQATASTTNEIASARAAPTTTKENGSGRSCRDAIPCSGTSMISFGSASAGVQDHDDLAQVVRLHLVAAGAVDGERAFGRLAGLARRARSRRRRCARGSRRPRRWSPSRSPSGRPRS